MMGRVETTWLIDVARRFAASGDIPIAHEEARRRPGVYRMRRSPRPSSVMIVTTGGVYYVNDGFVERADGWPHPKLLYPVAIPDFDYDVWIQSLDFK